MRVRSSRKDRGREKVSGEVDGGRASGKRLRHAAEFGKIGDSIFSLMVT